MVSVPERATPEFDDAETITVPELVPDAPLVIVKYPALLDEVQVQPVPCVLVTVNVTVPPLAPTLALVGVTLNAQDAAAACVTVTECPAIVSAPDRAPLLLAAAETVTVPLPVPEAPPVIVRKPALVDAVQPQPEPCVLVTVNVVVPPLAGTLALAGVTLNTQDILEGCVTVTVWVPIRIVPDRAAPLFAATETVTVPLPWAELSPIVIVRNPSPVDALQVQTNGVGVTVNAAVPPLVGTSTLPGVTLYAHDVAG